VLSHVFELRQELYSYLQEHEFTENFLDTIFFFWSKLVYLCDLFEKLNVFSILLQGSNRHILKLAENVSGFRKSTTVEKKNE
jgi:hypothetical protein